MEKIGNIEIADNITALISFPRATQTEVNDLAEVAKRKDKNGWILTNYEFKVLAQNEKLIVLEGTL